MPEDYDSFDSQQRRKFSEAHIEQWQVSGLSYFQNHPFVSLKRLGDVLAATDSHDLAT